MKYELKIFRQKGPDAAGEFQICSIETEDSGMTVAGALVRLNEDHPEDEIRWEHSCHQRKCGACAMLVNGIPMLACDAVLKKIAKRGRVTLEPLRKFPVVADLLVDRSILMNNLNTLSTWVPESTELNQKKTEYAFEASRCLQCGCCLEACPNFAPDEVFPGAAGFVPTTRLIISLDKAAGEEVRKAYREQVYESCGKSLACQKVCPAKIDIERLLSRSNALAVWRKND